MRLSDILKKSSQKGQDLKQDTAEKAPSKPEPQTKPSSEPKAAPETEARPKFISIPKAEAPRFINTSEPVKKPQAQQKEKPDTIHKAEDVFTQAIIEIKEILSVLTQEKPYPSDIKSIPKLLELIEHNNEAILMLACKSTPEVYLYGHSVNVCIFSILAGHAQKMPKNKLMNLAFFAFLNDFGLLKKLNITTKSGKLTASDYNKIKKHFSFDKDILNNIDKLAEYVKTSMVGIVSQTGQYNISSSYPIGLTQDSDVDEFTQIITISNIYEALIHPYNYQDRVIPHEALKTIINISDDVFSTNYVKSLVVKLSIYPPGSYVRINSNEIARVIGINRGLPTRPKIQIIIDPSLNRTMKLKIVDLAKSPMLFVKEAVDEIKLDLTDKKLLLELKAIRWWVKGI